ncbi:DENN domain-containing protein 1B-like isoform X1 [Malaclemys terrapin pileata]|uniref:DENN domain-containing protein 1B-like isoform X1 n=1 Tax=Malaclemys terrapin pileata TaxID=2991368 RepID=UPI0023A8F242|nr:DENN domain-containing protein 1B-like isoform X1 [Malaclemys terrapin pileata]
MGSRIKENPQKTFDLFFEAACPTSADDDPQVLRQFPEEFDDQESIQMLPKFCFPFDIERVKESTVVQNFTFALTDLEGNQRFGFCRLAGGFRTCLCILSYLPWFEVFYKILNNIADHLAKEQLNELTELLSALYCHPVPQVNSPVNLEFDQKLNKLRISTGSFLNGRHRDRSRDPAGGTESPSYFIAPDLGSLPTIPESRNLTEFVVAVDVPNMLQLYGSMLYERRILLTSSKLSTLTACVQASSAMLYPMYWQHIYIPTLPPHLLDYCCAPMPYLIGVHSSLMERVRDKALEDVVILNIDTNTLESPFQDLENLPSDVVSLLKLQLKKQSATTGDGVARAFLRAQALLFGGYRDALLCTPGQPISFCQESFLNHKSSTMREFLHNAVHLQFFKQFIDERLEKLNAGVGFSDVFEQEITNSGLAAGNLRSYQLWVESLKKGGGALIHTVKSKTNPAVKNMYKYAKSHARDRLKEMRSRLRYRDLGQASALQRGGSLKCDQLSGPILPRSTQSECLQSRLPITQHFGKSRPLRPNKRCSGMELEAQRAAPAEGHKAPPDPDAIPDGGEMDKSFLETGEIDLLGEIFETLSLVAPSGRGLLYGTRSLDFCNLEEGSCYTRLRHTNPSEENLSGRQARDHECWLLAEEDDSSLEFAPPSSEEASLAEEEAGDSQHALLLPAKATRPASGMWDRGINEDEEGPPQPAERVATLRVPWHKPFQLGEEELGGRGAGAELTPTTGSLGPPEEVGTGGHPEAATTGPESGQGVCRAEPRPKQDSPAPEAEPRPKQDSPAPEAEPLPKQDSPAPEAEPLPKQDSPAPEADSPSSPRVQSAVALFQAKACRQTDIRGGVPLLGAGATLPSSSWPELDQASQPPALPKVSELKKRFES